MILRGDVSKGLFGVAYVQEKNFVSNPKLQTGQYLIGRILYLCSIESGYSTLSKEHACQIVAKAVEKTFHEPLMRALV